MLGLDGFCTGVDGLSHRDAQLVCSTRQVGGDRRCTSSLAARGRRSSGYPAPLVDASASVRLRLRHLSLSRWRPVRLRRVPWRGLSRCRRAVVDGPGSRASGLIDDGWPWGCEMGGWSRPQPPRLPLSGVSISPLAFAGSRDHDSRSLVDGGPWQAAPGALEPDSQPTQTRAIDWVRPGSGIGWAAANRQQHGAGQLGACVGGRRGAKRSEAVSVGVIPWGRQLAGVQQRRR